MRINHPNQKFSKADLDQFSRIAKTSPVKIPKSAAVRRTSKAAGYQQISYSWQVNGWRYEARWHSKLPTAKIVTKPSWRVDRVKRGHGFGAEVHHRVVQTWSSHAGWIASKQLHQSAWRINHHTGHQSDKELIKNTHFHSGRR